MGAALIFSGLFLLKQMETELIVQRERSAKGITKILATALSVEQISSENFALRAAAFTESLVTTDPVVVLSIVDQDMVPLNLPGVNGSFDLDFSHLSDAKLSKNPLVVVLYDSNLIPRDSQDQSAIFLTYPFFHQGKFSGALQARFSLSDIRHTVSSAQKFFFLYVIFYGAVLVVFGIYLLGRTVVNPVHRLMGVTRNISEGDFDQTLPYEGPAEIIELAKSFNSMTSALRDSRCQSETLIQSLHQKNEDLHQTQGELIRSEKMASVGHLAAGMAHEIGNPLGAMIGYLEYLKSENPAESTVELIERALNEAKRIDRLVRDLLDYAAPDTGEVERFDLLEIFKETRELLLHQGVFEGIRFQDELPAALPLIFAVRHRLVQVLVNLLINARDAVAPSGIVRFSAGTDEGIVWLTVTDDGVGMNPETLAHVFDPFFTTKAPGRGRGLGLSVCYRIMEEAHGSIEVESQPGSGSSFRLCLPVAEG
jgi:signal transduction histidine kinase